MTSKLLERAFSEAARLPEDDQRALAEWILEEIQSEQRWQEAFALSQPELRQLAGEARDEFRAKKTQPLDESVL
ncbi:MAG: hypothetical protein AB1543_03335 [Candidatus Bipolaricaulota bacterium]